MSTALLTERSHVGKKTPSTPPTPPPPPGRIELQAPAEWIAELDRVAELMGMSRSAYIRHACNRQMAADRQLLSGPGAEPEEN